MSNHKSVDGPDTTASHDETQPIGAGIPAQSAPKDQVVPVVPVAQPTASEPGSTVPPTVGSAPGQRFVDRLWGIRSLIAVALAAVILGGLGGAAIAKAGEGGDQRDGFGPGGRQGGFGPRAPGGFGRNGPGGQRGGFGQGQPGVVPPTSSATSSPTEPSTTS